MTLKTEANYVPSDAKGTKLIPTVWEIIILKDNLTNIYAPFAVIIDNDYIFTFICLKYKIEERWIIPWLIFQILLSKNIGCKNILKTSKILFNSQVIQYQSFIFKLSNLEL